MKIEKLVSPHDEFSSWELVSQIYSIPRSVSGDGNLRTLNIINEFVGGVLSINFFEKKEYYSWDRPLYWNFKGASIATVDGVELVNTNARFLQVLTHSAPFQGKVPRDAILDHLFVGTEPGVIPYRTSYYKKEWGFCVSQEQHAEIMKHEELVVDIQSELLEQGVPYGEAFFKGQSQSEIIITTYICHPDMANNELSGILLLTRLIKIVNFLSKSNKLKYSIRLVLTPETFGSVAYIHENLGRLKNDTLGFIVLSCVGDGRELSVVDSRRKDLLNRCLRLSASSVAKERGIPFRGYDFLDRGSDERQYSSPGLNLDGGCFCNTKFGEYPEYHSSLDDLSVISEEAICMSAEVILRTLNLLSENRYPRNVHPCEPMLSKHGLYPHTRDYALTKKYVMDRLNFSAYSDGEHSLIDIAELTEMSDVEILSLYQKFKTADLIE